MNNKPEPTQLYRHFSETGQLLYVGISLRLAQRLYEHMKSSPWASEIAQIKVETFPSRALALTAEEEAIKLEKPVWNVIHNRERQAKARPAERKSGVPRRSSFDQNAWIAESQRSLIKTTESLKAIQQLSETLTIKADPYNSAFLNLHFILPPEFDLDHPVLHKLLGELMGRTGIAHPDGGGFPTVGGYSLGFNSPLEDKSELSINCPTADYLIERLKEASSSLKLAGKSRDIMASFESSISDYRHITEPLKKANIRKHDFDNEGFSLG